MQHMYAKPARSRCGHVVCGCTQSNRYARIHFSQFIIDLLIARPDSPRTLGRRHLTQIGRVQYGEVTATPLALLRGRAEDALSRATSQKVLGAYAESLRDGGALLAASGTGVWLNTRTTPAAAG
jgi:hypothetical protein